MKTVLPVTQSFRWISETQQPFLIAGPCSAETFEQLEGTAWALTKLNVNLIRAGIWKPRTRPNSFEGVGEIGLEWIKEIQQKTKIPFIIEVANPRHVESALKHNISHFWIGARTTANPFAVQEIADSLKGTQTNILVKNPINPDLALWIGALERLNNANITNLAACHRGFSFYGKSPFRNPPHWEIPLELRRQLPTLPLLCDPSHICGNTTLIKEIAQQSLDLGFNGLMIETHLNPQNALSDSHQQITPLELKNLLNSLIFKHSDSQDDLYKRQLDNLRIQIDELDDNLLEIIAKRMQIVKHIGLLKAENQVQYFQFERYKELLESRLVAGEKLNLSSEFTTRLLQLLHLEAIQEQAKNE